MGYDDISDANLFKLTTIRQLAIEMGSEVVKLLFHLMDDGKNAPSWIVTLAILVERQTTRPI